MDSHAPPRGIRCADTKGDRFLEGATQIVSQHHERYDGSGYPHRMEGDQICLGARIFAVADAVDAMTSDRPYRAGRSFDDAADELIRCSGAHFDPTVVQAFAQVPLDSWRELRHLSTVTGYVMKEQKTGAEIQYSALAVTGDRLASGWIR